jgi:hypothetical protein
MEAKPHSIMTDRDINSHEFNPLFWKPTIAIAFGMRPRIEAEEIVNLVADKLKPYVKGPECLDYSENNIYSDEVLNMTRWFIHYSRSGRIPHSSVTFAGRTFSIPMHREMWEQQEIQNWVSIFSGML